jgi:hypothetical protein
LDVLLSHVNDAAAPKQRGYRGRGNTVLSGAGFGDNPRFAHPPGQQYLADGIVDLVRAGVIQVLTL